MDELHADETPLDHVRRLRPLEQPGRLRARLAGFGLTADQADMLTAQLSGGQKARLTLLIATIDAPHLLILDEPTNHLDIESREALVEALTAYSGAVILVSHDMHLLNHVADTLWLVDGGGVGVWRDDLEAYRRHLLGEDKPAEKPAPRAAAALARGGVGPAERGPPLRGAGRPRSRRCATGWRRSWPTRGSTRTGGGASSRSGTASTPR